MSTQSALINVTPEAVRELKTLAASHPEHAVLRVYVAGRTCCGYRYGLTFVSDAADNDVVSEHDGLRLVVDPDNQAQCEDTVVDYVTTPTGAGFTVRSTVDDGGCSCGTDRAS